MLKVVMFVGLGNHEETTASPILEKRRGVARGERAKG